MFSGVGLKYMRRTIPSKIQNLSNSIKADEERMKKLVSTFLDDDIPKAIYLKQKDALMRSLVTLKEKKKDLEHQGNNWVEPLRQWILDTKQAAFLSESSDLHEIKAFVQKIGTNPLVRDKTACFAVPAAPSDFIAKHKRDSSFPSTSLRHTSALCEREVSFCVLVRPSSNLFPIQQRLTALAAPSAW